ncbi:unnamed protein product [Rotaria sp. Silwood1]|nr:unnamed protein product [Rotaria sp. Silwood1]CAF1570031.1 unnamed protein product [Rotaria sp. Silwood1]
MANEMKNNKTISIVDGLRVPALFDVDLFRSGLEYETQSDDIFIVTYPRSGTHWMSTIVYGLLTDGKPFNEDMGDYLGRIQFLDRFGKDAVKTKMIRPGVIQTHYPFNRILYHPEAKYIGVIRQPKDVCVSCYQILSSNPEFQFSQMDFSTFFQLFINGQTPYIDYFDHLDLLWSHKDDKNVLLISYEQMKNDLRSVIDKVAQFLNIDMRDKNQLIDRIEKHSSFEYMKENFDSSRHCFLMKQGQQSEDSITFIRKGIVGDWSSFMNDEQSQQLDRITAEKTRHMLGLSSFWNPSSKIDKHEQESIN